jgi:hypothetical protein
LINWIINGFLIDPPHKWIPEEAVLQPVFSMLQRPVWSVMT